MATLDGFQPVDGPAAPSTAATSQPDDGTLHDFQPVDAPVSEADAHQSALRRVADIGVSGIKGVAALGQSMKGLASMASGNTSDQAMQDYRTQVNAAGNPLFHDQQAPGVLTGAQQQADLNKEISQRGQAAQQQVDDAKGFGATAGAYLRNPSTLVNAAAEQAPGLAAAIAAGPAAPLVIGAQSGGTAAQNVLDQDPNNTAGMYKAGAIAGGVSAATVGLGGKFLTPAALEAGTKFAGDFLGRAAAGAVDQGVQGAAMGAGSALGENVGEGKPWSRGVGAAAVSGFVSGAVAGVGMSPFHGGHSALDGANPPSTGDAVGDAIAGPALLENSGPGTMYTFPDGTTSRNPQDVENYVNSLPVDQQQARRAQLYGMGAQQADAPSPVLSQIHDASGAGPQDIINQNLGIGRPPATTQANVQAALNEPTPFMQHDPATQVETTPQTTGDRYSIESGQIGQKVIDAAAVRDDAASNQAAAQAGRDAEQRDAAISNLFAKVGPRQDSFHPGLNEAVVGEHVFDGQTHGSTPDYNNYVDKLLTKEAVKSPVQHDAETLLADAWRNVNPNEVSVPEGQQGPYPTMADIQKYVKLTGIDEAPSLAQAAAKIDTAIKKLERSKAPTSLQKTDVLNEWRKQLTQGDPNAQSIHAVDSSSENANGKSASAGSSESASSESGASAEGSSAKVDRTQSTEGAPVQGRESADVRAEPAQVQGDLSPQAQRIVGKIKLKKGAQDGRLQGQEQAAAGDVSGRVGGMGPDAVRPAGVGGRSAGIEGGAAGDSSAGEEGAGAGGSAGDAAVSGSGDGSGEVDHPAVAKMRALVRSAFGDGPNAERNANIMMDHMSSDETGESKRALADKYGLDPSMVSKLTNDRAVEAFREKLFTKMKEQNLDAGHLMQIMHEAAAARRDSAEADHTSVDGDESAAEDNTPRTAEQDDFDEQHGYGDSVTGEDLGAGDGEGQNMGTISTVGGSQGATEDTSSMGAKWLAENDKAARTRREAGADQWKTLEQQAKSGVKFKDLPNSLKDDWSEFHENGHGDLYAKSQIVDRFQRGDFDEAYQSKSPAFNAMEEKNAGVSTVSDDYNQLGIGHVIDAPTSWRIASTAEGTDGYVMPTPGGGMAVVMSAEVFDKGPMTVAHTVRHELGHVIDDIGHGGVYSVQPELEFRMQDGAWVPVGEVAREIHALWKVGGDALNSYFGYPLNAAEHPLPRVAMQGEVFAQIWSMYTGGRNRTLLDTYAPKTAQFLKEVIQNVKEHPDAIQHGTSDSAESRTESFANRNSEGGPAASGSGSGDAAAAAEPVRAPFSDPFANSFTRRAESSSSGTPGDRPIDPAERAGVAERVISKLPEGAQPAVRSMFDTVQGEVKRGAQMFAFGHDLANWAHNTLGMDTPKTYMDLLSKQTAYRKDLDDALGKVMKPASELKSSDKQAASVFLAQTRRLGTWGYKPEWNPNAVVDPATAAKFNSLSKPVQDVIKSVNKLGFDQRAQLRQVNVELRKQFGDDAPQMAAQMDNSPYVPMRRHGEFIVEGKSATYKAAEAAGDTSRMAELKQDPSHYQYSHRETQGQANQLRDQLAQKFGANNVDSMAKSTYYKDNFGASWEKLQGWMNKIDANHTGTPEEQAYNTAFKKQLTDMYLQSIADTSARAGEMKFKNVAGIDDNQTLMSVAQNGGRHNAMVSNMLHGADVAKAMSDMQAEVHTGPSPDIRSRRQDIVNEYQKRQEAQMNTPPPSKVMDNLLAGNSFMRLALSPAHYMQYVAQPFTMALPDMAARYGWGKAAAAHVAAHKDVFDLQKKTGFLTPDYTKHVGSVGDEQGMLQALQKNGSLDATHDGDYGDADLFGGKVGTAMTKALNISGKMGTAIEMGNRISSALTSYRLAHEASINRGESVDTAHALGVKYATDTIRSAYGDYSAANAPRVLQSGFAGNGVGGQAYRAMTQFKKFTFIHTAMAAGMMHEAVAGNTPIERAVARKSLGYLYGHYAVLGGLLGVPGANLILGAYNKIFGDDGDTSETTIRKAIGDEGLADVVLHGAPALGGADLTERLGVGNLPNPYPGMHEGKTTRETMGNILTSVAGPLAGTAMNVMSGAGQMMNGDYMGGLATAMPAGITDGIKAYNMSQDGLQNSRGDTLVNPNDASALDILMKGIGGNTVKISKAQDQATSARDTLQVYKDQSDGMIKQYMQADKAGDSTGKQDIMKQWRDMQAEQRDRGLKASPLQDLIRAPFTSAKRGVQALNGVEVNRKDRGYVQQLQDQEGQQ